MRYLLYIILIISSTGFLHAQHNRCWVFGDSCYMEFTPSGPTIFPDRYTRYHYEMGACISDNNGNLLLYVNADSIYGPNDKPLLGTSQMVDFNSGTIQSYTQGAIILDDPSDENQFHVFAQAVFTSTINGLLHWKIRRENGNVNIVGVRDTIIYNNFQITEKMTATRHADGKSWWLVLHKDNSNNFIKFLLTGNGLIGPFVQSIGPTIGSVSGWGELVFSEQGDKLLNVSISNIIDLYQFDRCSGVISNWTNLRDTTPNPDFEGTYGASFSPDGSKIYVSEGYDNQGDSVQIVQFDLNASDIYGSRTQLLAISMPLGQHQLGPDGKIYISHYDGTLVPTDHDTFLTVIHSPNMPGLFSNAVEKGLSLQGRRSKAQLPNHPNYNLGPIMAQTAEITSDTLWICPGDSIQIGDQPDTTAGAVVWNWWPSTGLNQDDIAQPWASPTTTTKYYLSVEDTTLNISCTSTMDSVVIVVLQPQEFPVAEAGIGENLCLGDSIPLGPSTESTNWNYSWNPSIGLSSDSIYNPMAFPNQATTYFLTVTDTRISGIPGNCKFAVDSISLWAEPQFLHPPAVDTVFCPGEFFQFGPEAIPGFIYEWMPTIWLDNPHTTPVWANPPETSTYVLSITSPSEPDVVGCETIFDTITITANNCLYPNIVTPNGDGVNDVFDLRQHFTNPEIVIYDRWGAEVYRSNAYQNDWDAQGLPEGVYFYWLLEVEGLKPVVGQVTVLR